MATLLIIIIGGIVGLIYGSAIAIDRRLNWIVNFIVGAIGGLLGIWFFAGVLGLISATPAINVLLALLWTIVGAIILMAIVNAISASVMRSRGYVRSRRARTSRGYGREYDVEVERTVRRRRRR